MRTDETPSPGLSLMEELLERETQLKDELLSRVSHELRSPLTAIYQFTTIVLDGLAGDVNERQREYLQISLRNIRQLQQMIDDMLSATRAQSGGLGVRPQRISVAEAVADVLKTLSGPAEQKGVTLSSRLAAVPFIHADPSLVRQILIHLIHNGIKFTPEGGRVEVRCRSAAEEPDFVTIEVEDSGCGFPEGMAERVFEPLSEVEDADQGGRRGLGLGLYIARELVDRQQGRIWANSEPGRGSVVSFTLPCFSLARLIAPVVANRKRLEGSLSLLVVEASAHGASPAAAPRALIWEVLQRTLLPGMEVLLPQDSGGLEGRCLIVAGVEENSGQSAADRLEERLQRSPRLRQLGLQLQTTSLPIESLETAASEDGAKHLPLLASRIEGLVEKLARGAA